MTIRWTQAELNDYLDSRSDHDQSDDAPDDGPESRLQARIEDHCRRNGWYWFHDRSRGCNAPGHPDLVIALQRGGVLWLELKARGGRLTDEQRQVGIMLKALRQEYHVVRSYKQYLTIASEITGRTND